MVKFQIRLKNGETHWVAFPNAVEIHRAIVCIPKSGNDRNRGAPNFILLPDDVERVDVIDED